MIDQAVAGCRRMARLPLLWQHAMRVGQGATPSEVVYEEGHVQLLHYLSDASPAFDTPLVFVFALVNRPYILDLKEGKSVVRHFVDGGFDTYLVDWGLPSDADRHLTLGDDVNGYLDNIVDHVRERSGTEQVSILGYCMGGTMSAMYTALHPEKVRNLILMAAGIDFATRNGLLNVWTDPRYFDVDRFVDAFGNAPASLLQASFLMLKPVANLVQKPLGFLERMNDDAFVDDYFAMEAWLNDNIDVPGEVYRQFVKYLYQQNRLVKGQMPVGKHVVDLKRITCPVLNLMAARDDLVPAAQSAPFNDLVGSQDRTAITFDAGHIGLAVGSRAQRELWPQAVQWLSARSDRPAARPRRRRRRR
jgi:polyhydroxyalkanoate synthase